MRIALCDDDNSVLDFIENCVREYMKGCGVNFTIDRFSDGERFLENTEIYDIIFMDIYLNGITGIDVVSRIPAADRHHIIFITSSREYAVEAFGLGVTHYLVKPLSKEDVIIGLERCLDRIGKRQEKILKVKIGHENVNIPMNNIVYIEVFNKLSVIHTEKNVFRTYASLDSLFEQLDQDIFLRAQRSFIVNMCFVESFLFDRLILKDGTEITLSRSNRGTLKRQYQKFLFDLARRVEL